MITGSNGFCGQWLSKRLREIDGLQIIGTGRQKESVDGNLLDDYVPADLISLEETTRLVRQTRPDLVFHLAGGRSRSAKVMQQSNVDATQYLLTAIADHCGEAKTLLVGSAAEYGHVSESKLPIRETQVCRPVGDYAQTKYRATQLGLEFANRGLHVTVARPFNIVGAGMPTGLFLSDVLARLNQSLLEDAEPSLRVGNLTPRRDFIGVEDVVDAYVRLLQEPTSGEIYNICSGQAVSMRHVLELLLEYAPCPVRLIADPELARMSGTSVSYGCLEKAAQAIDFQPTHTLTDAIGDAWKHCFEGQPQ